MKMKKQKRNMAIGYVIVLIPLLILPLLIQSRADMGLINNALLLYMVSLGLNISLGLTGMSNLCQAAFWGIGAYTAAILVTKVGLPFLAVVPIAVVVTAIFSMLLGLLSTRIKGIYFAILTIGFALFFSLVLQNWPDVTGGGTGLRGIGDPDFIFFTVTSRKGLYVMLLLFCALSTWFYCAVANSKYGKSMIAIKFNDTAAELLGVDTVKRKMLAMALSGGLAGLSGALNAFTLGVVSPTQFIYGAGLTMVLILILGGSGTVLGVAIGSVFMVFLPEMLEPLQYWMTAIYGVLVAVVIMVLPGGLVSVLFRFKFFQKLYSIFMKKRDDDSIQDVPRILEKPEGPISKQPVLSVKNASISFGGLAAMSNVSLDLIPGEVHALIGPNGAGKSTLVNCITGVYKPSSGAIKLDGKSVVGLKPHKISRLGVSRTFQNLAVWIGLTSIDNLLVARDGTQKAGFWATIFHTKKARAEQAESLAVAKRMLVDMGLWDLRDAYIGTLPYGHQKMLEIARALMTKPKVLLLDEPAAGLTAPEVAILVGMIREIKESGVAVLLIDHNMKFVMDIADKITVLNYGKVLASDTPEAVRANPEVVEAYLGSGIKRTKGVVKDA